MDKQLGKMDEELKKASSTGASGTASQCNRPSIKSKTLASAENDDWHISNALIFAAIERIEQLQMEMLKCTISVENTVKQVKDTLDGMGKQLEEVTTKVQTLETTVTSLQKEKAELYSAEVEAMRHPHSRFSSNHAPPCQPSTTERC